MATYQEGRDRWLRQQSQANQERDAALRGNQQSSVNLGDRAPSRIFSGQGYQDEMNARLASAGPNLRQEWIDAEKAAYRQGQEVNRLDHERRRLMGEYDKTPRPGNYRVEGAGDKTRDEAERRRREAAERKQNLENSNRPFVSEYGSVNNISAEGNIIDYAKDKFNEFKDNFKSKPGEFIPASPYPGYAGNGAVLRTGTTLRDNTNFNKYTKDNPVTKDLVEAPKEEPKLEPLNSQKPSTDPNQTTLPPRPSKPENPISPPQQGEPTPMQQVAPGLKQAAGPHAEENIQKTNEIVTQVMSDNNIPASDKEDVFRERMNNYFNGPEDGMIDSAWSEALLSFGLNMLVGNDVGQSMAMGIQSFVNNRASQQRNHRVQKMYQDASDQGYTITPQMMEMGRQYAMTGDDKFIPDFKREANKMTHNWTNTQTGDVYGYFQRPDGTHYKEIIGNAGVKPTKPVDQWGKMVDGEFVVGGITTDSKGNRYQTNQATGEVKNLTSGGSGGGSGGAGGGAGAGVDAIKKIDSMMMQIGYDPDSANQILSFGDRVMDFLPGTEYSDPDTFNTINNRNQFIERMIRDASGAQIKEEEYDLYRTAFFPTSADSPEQVQRKLRLQELVMYNYNTKLGYSAAIPLQVVRGVIDGRLTLAQTSTVDEDGNTISEIVAVPLAQGGAQ